MTAKVKWGVLGVANIAVKKVIPAMQAARLCEVTAIASRDKSKAEAAARQLGIAKFYGSYEELLNDPEIEAIYNPLPNHLHVEWTMRAAESGKHVLCEKPISMSVAEALPLLEVSKRTGKKIEEAFMVRTNPQWLGVLKLVRDGRIGEVRSVVGYFSYNNPDPHNIRNVREFGGGGLMDIGCYLIYVSRLIFGVEPLRVVSLIKEDPETKTDVLTSAILHFPSGQSIFTCSTRLTPYQRVQILGTLGRIEIQIPFNAPPDRSLKVFIDDGSDLTGKNIQTIEFEPTDQYTVQADLFSEAIRGSAPLAIPLEESIRNMAVIEALVKSAASGQWETPAWDEQFSHSNNSVQ